MDRDDKLEPCIFQLFMLHNQHHGNYFECVRFKKCSPKSTLKLENTATQWEQIGILTRLTFAHSVGYRVSRYGSLVQENFRKSCLFFYKLILLPLCSATSQSAVQKYQLLASIVKMESVA